MDALLLTGTAGVGKSAVAKEIHELLWRAGTANAMLDLDAFGKVAPVVDPPYNSNFIIANLRAVWPQYVALDLAYVVFARLIQSQRELVAYREVLGASPLAVCRLEASTETVADRLIGREPGVARDFLLRVSPTLADELRGSAVEDLVVDNGRDRSVTEVAQEILSELNWTT